MNVKSQLCTANDLKLRIEQERVTVLDGSWYLPSQKINSKDEYEKQHIPGAQFFDIDTISDQDSNLPHMLPSAEQFSNAVSDLGISNESDIVVYDSVGLFSAARVWWTFKAFGHNNIQVLDGGLPAWKDAGGALENNTKTPLKGNYVANRNSEMVADRAALIENLTSKQCLVLDARPHERFLGAAPEPRPGLPSGHMPGSISFSSSNLIADGKLKPRDTLKQLFDDANITSTSSIVTSCGSGVTAAIITLALAQCGYGLHQLYDGSWAEWGAADDAIILNKSS